MGLPSANAPISAAAPTPISSNMDPRSGLPTKTTSFEPLNVYPLISLKEPPTFGFEIKYKAVTSSLSGEGY